MIDHLISMSGLEKICQDPHASFLVILTLMEECQMPSVNVVNLLRDDSPLPPLPWRSLGPQGDKEIRASKP